ncbi:VWA domain-containing protein [Pseudomonas aeruginosa]|uniref:VWA domain-containing protein n=1 Tax=Pseudomonas aeruginosa TaxID=287 RepID=UPI002E2BC2FE|nr:VWA domain-containing protein [Pseudomonas aeruginosa]
MSNKSLIGSLPIYAQHLAEQTGVKVFVEGTIAYTNAEREVYIPFAEDDLQLSFGYTAHECSHVRNTDMECFQEAAPKPFRKNLLNALEDIRIERRSMDQYPGTEDDLRYLNRRVLLEPFQPDLVATLPPLHVVQNAILLGGYWLLQEPQLEVPAVAYMGRLAELVGQELTDQIMEVVKNTLKCADTWEVLDLVDTIIAMLPSSEKQAGEGESDPEQGEEEPGDKPTEANSGDDGKNKSDQPSSAGGEPGDDDGSNDSEAESSSRDAGEGQGKTQPQQAPGSGEKPTDGPRESAHAGEGLKGAGLRELALTATEEDLKGLISDVGDAAAQLLTANAKNNPPRMKPLTLEGRATQRNDEASRRRVQLGLEQSSGLRQCMYGLLQAQVDCRVSLKRQGKRIDTGRIAMLAAGETRIFRSKARAEQKSAAVQLLLDKSTSMHGSMEQAEAAIYAVLQALENIPQVTTGAMSFPNRSPGGVERCALIKSPKERLITAVQSGGFGASSQGDTPLARALWPAAVEVLRARGERKLLFVVTDGRPDSGTEHLVRELVERCEASGIEVIGLGFGGATAAVLQQCFTRYQAIGQVSNLKNALYGLVREALVA